MISEPRGHLYTVGHSTRPLEELIALLEEYAITQLVDVRHFPGSRHNPQFNEEHLRESLPSRGIAYRWMGEELGGFRTGGYQPYMTTQAYAGGIEQLERLAQERVTAIMCAEIVWFRCHRRFIARTLVIHGYRVTHIVGAGKRVYEEGAVPAVAGDR